MAFTFVLCQSVPLTYLPLPHTHTHHHRLHLHYHCSVYPQFLLASYLPACTGTARQFPCVGGNGWRPVSNAYGVIKSKLGFHPHATFDIENSPEMCGRNILPSSFATILLNFAPPCALCFILLIFPCFHSESASRLLLPLKREKGHCEFLTNAPSPTTVHNSSFVSSFCCASHIAEFQGHRLNRGEQRTATISGPHPFTPFSLPRNKDLNPNIHLFPALILSPFDFPPPSPEDYCLQIINSVLSTHCPISFIFLPRDNSLTKGFLFNIASNDYQK